MEVSAMHFTLQTLVHFPQPLLQTLCSMLFLTQDTGQLESSHSTVSHRIVGALKCLVEKKNKKEKHVRALIQMLCSFMSLVNHSQ